MRMSTKILRSLGTMLCCVVALMAISSEMALNAPIAQVEQATGHISNGSGSPESHVTKLNFQGTLKTRFSDDEIRAGTREAVAIAVALCDGGTIANTNVQILPSIVSGTPSIAGGLAAMPCISIGATDGLATGVNGAILTFLGPLAQYIGTVRMYADLDCDGVLFETADLVQQMTPQFQGSNVIAHFGRTQGQFMFTSSGDPLGAADPIFGGGAPHRRCTTFPGMAIPLIILFTVDIDQSAAGGRVEVALGLQVGDDTALGKGGPCVSAMAFGSNCGSNIRGGGPETNFFDVVGSGGGAVPPGGPPPPPPPSPPPSQPPSGGSGGSSLASYDFNGNCELDNSEFFALVDAWLGEDISDIVFFSGIDAWISESNICAVSSSSVRGFSLSGVSLSESLAGNAISFRANGQGIASSQLEVYDLRGQRIFAAQDAGSQLTWNLNSGTAHVANGVYLYRVSVESAGGDVLQSGVRKLVVMR